MSPIVEAYLGLCILSLGVCFIGLWFAIAWSDPRRFP